MSYLARGSVPFALALLVACNPPADEAISDATSAPSADDCAPGQNWFPHSATPAPDSLSFNNQCDFHRWSWQAFLWLTQDTGSGEPRFLSFMTPEDLFAEGTDAALMPRFGKSRDPKRIGEFLQAGTAGIMTDLGGRPIYYSMYVDSVFAGFVAENNLTDPTAVREFSDTTNFPVGAFTLKASWKIVDGEDASDFFTMPAEVYPLEYGVGRVIQADTTRTESVTLALVGFHIAGRVEDHPEMVWATFEHERNAPNVYSHANVGDTVRPSDPVSTESFTFYAANTTLADCNVNSSRRVLDPATQTITPATQVCREYEFGNLPPPPSDTSGAAALMNLNDANIASLNGHVLDSLSADDVWSNYTEVGAIWFRPSNALRPGDALDTDSLLIGSLRLSNSTIETFTQDQSTMYSCFRCHNTRQRITSPASGATGPGGQSLPAKNINISHIIVNGYFRDPG